MNARFFFLLCLHILCFFNAQAYDRLPEQPLITIITSVYKSDFFIQGFLEDIVQQTIFDQCELLLIDAHSPGNEKVIIQEYQKKYSNITYVRLEEDPGLYGVWNIGARMARSPYICNANTDDRLAFDCYQKHAHFLNTFQTVDLVYSNFYYTKFPNETMAHNHAYRVYNYPEFSPGLMYLCLPNNHPMWRASLHDRFGYFDEKYKSAGDWEFWCRIVAGGSRFKLVPGLLALFYNNPTGLSTDSEKRARHDKEVDEITKKYNYMFKREKMKVYVDLNPT